jgi:lysophospholipase L1-like esterase
MVAAVLVGVGVAAVLKARDDEDGSGDPAERIVMLGDSLTEEGNWNELFPERDMVNAGFSGYTTEQIARLAGDAVRAQPAAVFVLSGTNDVFRGYAPSWTADRLDELVTAIETESPGTRIVLQTVLPSAEMSAGMVATNDAIRRLAATRGLEVLDLHPEFDDGSGGLREAETYDGVHLTAAGYARWATLLGPWFDRLDDVTPPSE